ncbi:hypothetical protein Tco_0024246 [Tanacetum coccineum]
MCMYTISPYDQTNLIPEPDDELTEKKLKQVEADDQAIQTILLGLPEDIYATVDSCETAQEIWLHVQQMMKGFDIGIQEKKAKLFNEWERWFGGSGGNQFRTIYWAECRIRMGIEAYRNVKNQRLGPSCKKQHRSDKERSCLSSTQLLICSKTKEAGIHSRAEEFDLMAAATT